MLTVLLTLKYTVLYAAAGKVRDYVLDNQITDSLPGANVYLEGIAFGAATDLNSKYAFKLAFLLSGMETAKYYSACP